jgi:LysR family transcriptional activator of nhaA
MKAVGAAGTGLFPAPTVIASKVEAMYGVRRVGLADRVNETYYAISPERKISHPAVLQITEFARTRLFADL